MYYKKQSNQQVVKCHWGCVSDSAGWKIHRPRYSLWKHVIRRRLPHFPKGVIFRKYSHVILAYRGSASRHFSAAVQSAEKNDRQEKRDISAFSANSFSRSRLSAIRYRLNCFNGIGIRYCPLLPTSYHLSSLVSFQLQAIDITLSIQADHQLHYIDTSWARQIMLS